MTEKETREKICEIISPYVSAWGDDTAIADALVEAGLRFGESYSHTATFNMAQLDRINELERRLAEAGHEIKIRDIVLYKMADTINWEFGTDDESTEEYIEYHLRKAEQELAEEDKR